MDLKKIDDGINGLRTSRKHYLAKTQELAIAIMQHAKDHGDCSRALKLTLVCGKREQGQMIAFFTAFSPINVVIGKTATENKCNLRKPDNKKFTNFDIDGAAAIHWLDYAKPKKPPKEFSLTTFREDLQKLIKRYETLVKEGKADDGEDIINDIAAFRLTAADRGKAKNTPVQIPKTMTDLAEEALANSEWGKAA